MYDLVYAAALERKLEAAQREIETWRKHNADAIELIDLLKAEREACEKLARKAILSIRTDTQKARDMTLAELREECADRAAAAIRARAAEQRERKGE